jgi:hypothetical protein
MAATAGRGRVARVSVVLAADNFGHVTFTGHSDVGLPVLGCKLRGRSRRELQALGLLVDDDGGDGGDGGPPPAGAA